ncbi:MAG TPA: hypothetical protein VJ583_01565, partial [Nitrososphaeraceae archaeon]|nr:hypothetical protein [Nitrososphaeraceae archaeon]
KCSNNNLNTDLLSSSFFKEVNNIKSNSLIFSILNLDKYKNIVDYKSINFLREKIDLSFLVHQIGNKSELDQKLFDFKIKITRLNDVICINLRHPYSRIYGLEIENMNNSNTLIRIDPLI